ARGPRWPTRPPSIPNTSHGPRPRVSRSGGALGLLSCTRAVKRYGDPARPARPARFGVAPLVAVRAMAVPVDASIQVAEELRQIENEDQRRRRALRRIRRDGRPRLTR